MRKLTIGLLAAAAFACATPAFADGISVRARPSGVAAVVHSPVYSERVYSYHSGYRWGGAVYHGAYAYEPGIVQSSWVDPAYVHVCRTTVVRNRWGEVRRTRHCG